MSVEGLAEQSLLEYHPKEDVEKVGIIPMKIWPNLVINQILSTNP
jgi:hypothetical protein